MQQQGAIEAVHTFQLRAEIKSGSFLIGKTALPILTEFCIGNDLEKVNQNVGPNTLLKSVKKCLLISLPVVSSIFILNLPQRLGIRIWDEQYLAVFLGITLTAVFLTFPAARKEHLQSPKWYDYGLIGLTLLVCGYLVVNWPEIALTGSFITTSRVILGTACVLILLEATRRIFGYTLLILVAVFIVYSLFTDLFPGPLYGKPIPWRRLPVLLYLDKNSLLGITLKVAATYVIPFILFGQLIFATGAGDFLLDSAFSIFGKTRGAPAKLPVVASSVFGSVSGVAVANVYTTGQITIPLMKKNGVEPHIAAAIEAAASTGGLILPPIMGVVAFIMAVFLNITYARICIAAVLPALLYYIALYIQVDRYAARRELGSLSSKNIRPFLVVLKSNWLFLLPLFMLVYLLFATPIRVELAALYSAGAMIVVNMFYRDRRINLSSFLSALETTGRGTVEITVVCAISGFIIGTIMFTGFGFALTRSLVALSGGHLFPVLLMCAAICIILGMGMPIVTVYIIGAILIVPALTDLGIADISGHMFVFYFGMLSFLTPPVMLSCYAAATIAHSDPWKTAWAAIRFSISAYVVPFVFIYNAALLMTGPPLRIVASSIAALAGISMISLGIEGHIFRQLNPLARLLLMSGGLAMLWLQPIIRLAGLAVCAAIFLWELKERRISRQKGRGDNP